MLLAMIGFWQSMEGRMPVGLLFGAVTAAAVWHFWKADGSDFNLYAAGVTLIVVEALVVLLNGKRFHGPPIGDEIKQRQAEISKIEETMESAS
jgi:hypothetical protein